MGSTTFRSVEFTRVAEIQPPVRGLRNPRNNMVEPAVTQSRKELDGAAFVVDLAPGSGSKLKIEINRNAGRPSYHFPWNR